MTIQLNLPDDINNRLKDLAADNGFDSVEQYAEALLRAEVEEVIFPPAVEQEILRRLDDPTPPVEYNEQFKADLLRQFGQRNAGR